MARRTEQAGRRVAVTGAAGDLALLLIPALEAHDGVDSVLALDVSRPERLGFKSTYRRLDLARPEAERLLTDLLLEEKVDVLVHLAQPLSPAGMGAIAHELEVAGTLSVLSAVARAKVGRLVVSSFTVVYGARGQNPSWLTERSPLHGCPQSRFVTDKVEVERQVEAFRRANPQTRVMVLRFAPILGARVDNPMTRLLRQKRVPTLLGFDPVMQAVHEEDAVEALHRAVHSDAEGPVNVVGEGVVSLSGVVHLAGGYVVPIPAPLARAGLSVLEHLGLSTVKAGLLDYLRYSFVADGARAREALGFIPRYETRQAVAAVQGGA